MRGKLLPLVLLALSTNAFAFDLAAVGVMGMTNVSVDTPGALTSSGNSYGFGALFSATLVPLVLDWEVGGLWLPRKVTVTAAGADQTYSFGTIQVPALVRLTALPIVSVGAGAYYSRGIGDVNVTPNSGVATSQSFSAASLSQSDFGLVASVGAKYSLIPMFKLLADLRYLKGMGNASTSTATTEKFTDFQLLVGASFGL